MKVEFEITELEAKVLEIAADLEEPKRTPNEFARICLLQTLADEPVNIGNALQELLDELEAEKLKAPQQEPSETTAE